MTLGIIKVGIAPLYGHPDTNQVLVDEALYGMGCTILQEKESFYRVLTEYGYEGWTPVNNVEKGEWPKGLSLLRVQRRQIDVLDQTDVTSVILETMPRGSVLAKAQEVYNRNLKEGWVCVRLASGRLGYTKESYLSSYIPISRDPNQTPAAIETEFRTRLLETVKAYEGTQYRWGGKSPQGIDCSGLVSMAYLMNGVIIHRDASMKPEFGMHAISVDKIKPGDLLFFKGHVAMYVGTERRLYIHSTAKNGCDGVVYNSLDPKDPIFRKDLAEGILEIGSIYPLPAKEETDGI